FAHPWAEAFRLPFIADRAEFRISHVKKLYHAAQPLQGESSLPSPGFRTLFLEHCFRTLSLR
ncbi:MAG: hypothetical protein V3T65_03670, partial [Acidobacteriota bacterium]